MKFMYTINTYTFSYTVAVLFDFGSLNILSICIVLVSKVEYTIKICFFLKIEHLNP